MTKKNPTETLAADIKTISPIAYIKTDYKEKFGIPRQAGIITTLPARIVFRGEYRNPEALRGIEDFSRLWLIWGFSKIKEYTFSPTVRPPRLGGNVKMGVFATRSPFRPNQLGLSCVSLSKVIETDDEGVVLEVYGADLMDGTPIYDIKPYVPYADSHQDAGGGFADAPPEEKLQVNDPREEMKKVPKEKQEALRRLLALDPRPAYTATKDGESQKKHGMAFGGFNVVFQVEGVRLEIVEIQPESMQTR